MISGAGRCGFMAVAVSVVLMVTMLTGCNSSGCSDNQSALPLMGFYDSATGSQITLSGLELGGVGAPGDSLLILAGESCSQVYLPFRDGVTSTSFYIRYSQEGINSAAYNDTITFVYNSEPYFASSECGAMYKYQILEATTTHHLIDSIAVTDPIITNVDLERIKLFFRTSSSDDDADNSDDDDNGSSDNEEENPEEGDEV
jgi:hypothetical protein